MDVIAIKEKDGFRTIPTLRKGLMWAVHKDINEESKAYTVSHINTGLSFHNNIGKMTALALFKHLEKQSYVPEARSTDPKDAAKGILKSLTSEWIILCMEKISLCSYPDFQRFLQGGN